MVKSKPILEQKRHIDWLDVAKGIGIILVFLGHAPRDIMREEYFGIDFGFQFIYSFHMQLFFIVSGILFMLSYQKYSPLEFLKKKAKTLLIPWVVYTLLIYVIRYAADFVPQIKGMLSEGSFAMMPILKYLLLAINSNNPYSYHLWFILISFIVQVICYCLFKLVDGITKNNKKATAIIVLIVSIVAFVGTRFLGSQQTLRYVGQFMFSFCVGCVAICFDIEKLLGSKAKMGTVAVVSLATTIVYSYFYNDIMLLSVVFKVAIQTVFAMAFAPVMCVFVFGISKAISASRIGRAFAWLGKYSFTFYLLHQPVSCALAGTVMVAVLPASLASYIVIMAVCLVLCVAFPYVAVKVLYKLHLGILLKPLNIPDFAPLKAKKTK